MTPSIPPADTFVGMLAQFTFIIITITALFGVPLLVALAVRFLWYRHVYIGKSKEMETLILQLHRIASALEAQQAATPQAETPHIEGLPRPIPLSMFGR